MSIYLFIYLCIYIYLYLSIYLHLSMYLYLSISIHVSISIYIYLCIYIVNIYLDVVIVVTQEFRSLIRLLLQTTELLVGTVFPLLLLTCGRCVLFFDVVEKKLFSVHTVSENFVVVFNHLLDIDTTTIKRSLSSVL